MKINKFFIGGGLFIVGGLIGASIVYYFAVINKPFYSPELYEKFAQNNKNYYASEMEALKNLRKESARLRFENEELHRLIPNDKKWITFNNEELGLSFSYPLEFGQLINFGIGNGDTGKHFGGHFRNGLEFGGETDDFSAGRGGWWTDEGGYIEKEDNYYYRPWIAFDSEAKPEIIPPEKIMKILTVNGNKILIVDLRPHGEGGYEPNNDVSALINLKNKEFPGFVFYNSDVEKIPLEQFEAILKTIEIK